MAIYDSILTFIGHFYFQALGILGVYIYIYFKCMCYTNCSLVYRAPFLNLHALPPRNDRGKIAV